MKNTSYELIHSNQSVYRKYKCHCSLLSCCIARLHEHTCNETYLHASLTYKLALQIKKINSVIFLSSIIS